MYIIYPNLANNKRVSINMIDPKKQCSMHTANSMILKLLVKRGITFDIKQRANIELEICEKKIEFWARKLNAEALQECTEIAKAVLPDFVQTYSVFMKWE